MLEVSKRKDVRLYYGTKSEGAFCSSKQAPVGAGSLPSCCLLAKAEGCRVRASPVDLLPLLLRCILQERQPCSPLALFYFPLALPTGTSHQHFPPALPLALLTSTSHCWFPALSPPP